MGRVIISRMVPKGLQTFKNVSCLLKSRVTPVFSFQHLATSENRSLCFMFFAALAENKSPKPSNLQLKDFSAEAEADFL